MKCPCEQCETTINHTIDLLEVEEKKVSELTQELAKLKGIDERFKTHKKIEHQMMKMLLEHGTFAMNYRGNNGVMHSLVLTVAAKASSQNMPMTPLLPYPASQNK
jgi:hypothetical protein